MSSFTEYTEEYKKKKKKKKDSEITSSTDEGKQSFTDYTRSVLKTDNIAPISKKSEKKEKKTAFQKSKVFDDGYQVGDVTKTILGTGLDAAVGFTKGVLRLGEGIVDLGGYGVAGAADLLGADEFAEKTKKAMKKDFVSDFSKGIDEHLDDYSVLGHYSDAVTEGLGQVAGIILTGGLGGAAGLGSAGVTALTTGVMGASSMGSGMSEAYQDGATDGQAVSYGAMKGVVDAGTELIFGGLGKSVKALGLSRGISSLDDVFAKKLSNAISSKITNQTLKTVVGNTAEYGVKAGTEGLEELLAGFGSAVAKNLTYKSDEELKQLVKDENLLEQFVVGSLVSGIAQGGDFYQATKSGKDFVTDLTANDQKVVDAEVESRIAEEEKDGTKLTKKEKNKIYDDVVSDLEKGRIDTDKIESVLGGETYKTYKETVDKENALEEEIKTLQKEHDELNAMRKLDMSGVQDDRLQELKNKLPELKQQLEDFKGNFNKDGLKEQLSNEVFELAKDSKLVESYNEKARRQQKLDLDVNEYKDENAKKTVQNAIKYGMHNGTDAKDFVNLCAKLSADKGYEVDFLTTAELRESIKNGNPYGIKADPKRINAFVDEKSKKIILNMSAKKSLNSLVGHEITHTFENSINEYEKLQEVAFEFAKTKGEYDSRYKDIEIKYSDLDADIEKELTSDIVGDYLFTDNDFVHKLSTEHRNIFQKIYDEIKYLCKIATAGSKEARQFEKLKKTFEDVYRETTKTESGNVANGKKYSLCEFDDGQRFVSVETDQDLFDGLDSKGQIDLATKIIKERFQGKVIGLDNKAFVNGKTVDEFTHPAKHIDADIYEAKLKASTELDNLMDAGFNFRNEADGRDGHTHTDVTGGFDYFDVIFKVGTEYYQGLINVKNINRGKLLKDITKIKNITKDMTSRYGNNPSYAFLRDVSMQSISQNSEKSSAKYSLSAEQEEYFKDSVVRDENGQLKVMYHGTSKGGHTVFDTYGSNYGLFGQGSYFTDNKDVAESYTKKSKGNNPQVYESYLNITNPIDMDAQANPVEWHKAFPDVNFRDSGTNEQFYRDLEEDLRDMEYPKWEASEIAIEGLQSMGYDGITHIGGGRFNKADDTRHRVYIAFESEQIKNIDNLKPTSDPDIRYSLSEDSEGRKLSKEQQEFFADSKIRVSEVDGWKNTITENGALLPVYHGTNSGDFYEFDKKTIGSANDYGWFGKGFYFAFTKGEARFYGNRVLECYLDVKKPFVYSEEMGTFDGQEKGDVNFDFASFIVNLSEKFPEIAQKTFVDVAEQDSNEVIKKSFVDFAKEIKEVYDSDRLEVVEIDDMGKKIYQYRFSRDIDSLDTSERIKQIIKEKYVDNLWVADFLKEKGDITEAEYNEIIDLFDKYGSEQFDDAWLTGKYDSKDYADKNRLSAVVQYLADHKYSYLDQHMPHYYMESFIGDSFTQELQKRGYDGILQSRYGDEVVVFESNQIKLTDNKKPTSNPDIRYSLSEADDTYLNAVEKGDTETAQKLVDEAARNSMPNSKVVDANGILLTVYHGSPSKFTVFNHNKMNAHGNAHGRGFYFTENKSLAEGYEKDGGQLLKGYLNIEKPLSEDNVTIKKSALIKLIQATCETEAKNLVADGGYDSIQEAILDTWISNYVDTYNTNIRNAYREVADIIYSGSDNDVDIIAEITNGGAGVENTLKNTYKVLGYDGVIYTNPYGTHEFVSLISNQFKSTEAVTYDDNGNVIPLSKRFNAENEDIRYSLSSENEQLSVFGNYNVYAKDITLAPIREDVANNATTTDNAVVEPNATPPVAPIVEKPTATTEKWRDMVNSLKESDFDREYAVSIYQEAFNTMMSDVEKEIDSGMTLEELAAKTSAIQRELDQLNKTKESDIKIIQQAILEGQLNLYDDALKSMQRERLATLDDADAPPEVEAPYRSNNYLKPDDPFYNRDMREVGNRKVKAYMYENPEVKPFFQEEANIMLGELHRTTKGEKIYTPTEVSTEYGSESYGVWNGTKRDTSAEIAYLLDECNYTYAEIEKGLEAIIKDHGAENNACSKRIEFMLNDRLLKGYKDFEYGIDIPPNQDYVTLLNEKQITEYNEEAFNRFMETADNYAPPETENDVSTINESITTEEKATTKGNRKVSNVALKRLINQKPSKRLDGRPNATTQGAVVTDGKQYLSYNGRFVVELNTPDESIPINEKLDVNSIKGIFEKVEKDIIKGNYEINAQDISRIRKDAPKGTSKLNLVAVGDSHFDINYVDAVLRAIENPTISLSNFIGNDKALVIKGSNGQSIIAPVHIKEITDDTNILYSAEKVDTTVSVAPTPTPQNVAPITKAPIKATESEAIKPAPETYEGEEAEWANNKMARADKSETEQVAKILTEEPTTEKKKRGLWSYIKESVLDKGMVFETLSKKNKNRELEAKWNFIRYADGNAQTLIGKGAEGVKSLKDIQAEVEETGHTKEFYEYLYHKHNVDRMNLEGRYKDIKNKPVFSYSVTSEASQEIVNQYEFAEPKFKEYAQDVYDYMNHLRNMMVDNGVISQKTADLWAEMYPHYVPIRRVGDTGLNINVPLDTGRTSVNAPIKAATGGSRDILPLFDTMAQRTMQTYKAVAKNSFGVELKNTLGTTIKSDMAKLDDIIDGIDTQDELLQEGKNGNSPTFTVFENGERVTFEITDEMYDALKPKSEKLAYRNKFLNTVSNVQRGLLTEYNPVFLLTNAVKDAQDVLINSQHAIKTYANFPKAIAEMITKGKYYTEYMSNGGEQNTYFDNESSTFAEDKKGIKKVIGMPLDIISGANNVIERLPRLAEYIASRKNGRSIEVSMLDAARVTTNFAAGGDVTKFLDGNGCTFLSASVNGAVQQVRNIQEAKMNGLKGWVGLATKYAIAGIPAMILNQLLWDDDEEYEELSDYVKENYYVVAKYGDGKFVRIPKGRALAVIQNAMEQIKNAATGDDEVDLKNFLDLAVSNLAPNNPIDNNVIAPIMQVASNKTWYGDELVPTRLQDLPAAEQFDESTDAISKWLGEKLNYSPYKINYLLNQYSGGVGDVALPMITPEAESGDNSLVGNFIAPLKDKFTTDSVMKNQNISDFYDTVDKLTTNANSSKATDEDILKYKYMNSVNAELGELYQQKREIQNGSLSADRKYAKVREIQEQIDELAKESLSNYNNVQVDGKYATVDDRHFRWKEPSANSDEEAGWVKINDKQLEKQKKVTAGLGISASDYWDNKEEYDYAYEYPEKYAVAKAVGGYETYKTYSKELNAIKSDKDSKGKSISGSRKEKVLDYINNLDADYYEKIILFKSEYNADDRYNYEIIDYLNNRDDISYDEMVSILKELGFTVLSDGSIQW